MKYKTIPKTVDAIHWDGDKKTLDAIEELVAGKAHIEYFNRCLFIGGFAVNTGEYVVVEGDHIYKMLPEQFEEQFVPEFDGLFV